MKKGGIQERYYQSYRDFRDNLLRPVVKILDMLSIKPRILSYMGVLTMLLFIVFVRSKPVLALVFMLITILFDNVDGPLARYQKRSSDKGKFVDVICDNLNFSLFIIGLVLAGLINGLVGMIYIYFMLFSKVLRAIWHSKYYKSDWMFKPIAGLLPNVFVVISYLLYPLYLINQHTYFNSTSIVFSAILIMDTIKSYNTVLSMKTP